MKVSSLHTKLCNDINAILHIRLYLSMHVHDCIYMNLQVVMRLTDPRLKVSFVQYHVLHTTHSILVLYTLTGKHAKTKPCSQPRQRERCVYCICTYVKYNMHLCYLYLHVHTGCSSPAKKKQKTK